jgi:beta-lactamase class A
MIALCAPFQMQLMPQTTGGKSGLTKLLEAELSRFPARAGLYVKHLRSGEEAGVRADEAFNSASVIKLPVMVIAFQMADQKKLNLDDRVEIGKSDYRGGTGIFKYHDLGQTPTLRDVITEMIITSDNTATDMMIAKVGGVARVNQWLGDNGYKGLKLNSTANELFRKRYELTASQSDRSACMTSTRAARAAGSTEAITAAAINRTAEPATTTASGIFISWK